MFSTIRELRFDKCKYILEKLDLLEKQTLNALNGIGQATNYSPVFPRTISGPTNTGEKSNTPMIQRRPTQNVRDFLSGKSQEESPAIIRSKTQNLKGLIGEISSSKPASPNSNSNPNSKPNSKQNSLKSLFAQVNKEVENSPKDKTPSKHLKSLLSSPATQQRSSPKTQPKSLRNIMPGLFGKIEHQSPPKVKPRPLLQKMLTVPEDKSVYQ